MCPCFFFFIFRPPGCFCRYPERRRRRRWWWWWRRRRRRRKKKKHLPSLPEREGLGYKKKTFLGRFGTFWDVLGRFGTFWDGGRPWHWETWWRRPFGNLRVFHTWMSRECRCAQRRVLSEFFCFFFNFFVLFFLFFLLSFSSFFLFRFRLRCHFQRAPAVFLFFYFWGPIRLLLGFTGFYLEFSGFYLVFLFFIDLEWVLMGFT